MATIQIIEDNVEIATLLKDLLVKEGFETLVCYDGLQGMEFARKHKPDLILLDLMLPAGGGFYVLERLKLSTHTNIIPVIVLTASKDKTHKDKAMTLGVDGYIEKPYENEELLAAIKATLAKKSGQ